MIPKKQAATSNRWNFAMSVVEASWVLVTKREASIEQPQGNVRFMGHFPSSVTPWARQRCPDRLEEDWPQYNESLDFAEATWPSACARQQQPSAYVLQLKSSQAPQPQRDDAALRQDDTEWRCDMTSSLTAPRSALGRVYTACMLWEAYSRIISPSKLGVSGHQVRRIASRPMDCDSSSAETD